MAPMSATPTTPPTTPPAIAPLLVDEDEPCWGSDETVAEGVALDDKEEEVAGMSVEVGCACSDEVIIGTSVEVGSGITDESVETEGVAFGSDVEVISALGSDVVVVSHQLVVVVSM